MHNLKIISLIFLVLSFCFFIYASPQNFDPSFFEHLNEKLSTADKSENFSGVILISKDDSIIFEKAYGLSSRSHLIKNNVDTKFNLASVGKLFTSLAIAQLAQANKLNVNDPINKHLDNWLEPDIANNITISDLLTHSSGLGSFFNNENFKLGNASGLYLAIKDYKPLVQNEKSVFPSGTSQLYSNTGYLLLGAIIESVSGENYFEYVQKHIFDVAHMPNSGFFEMDDPVPNLAIGFGKYQNNNSIKWKNNLFTNVFKGSPAGGGFSTAHDMKNFANALMNGKLLNETYTKLFLSGKVKRPEQASGYFKKTIEVQGQIFEGVFSPYGFAGEWNNFGLAVFNKDPLCLGHDGGGMRGINNLFALYPEDHIIFILFSNYTGEEIIDPRNEILKAINMGK